MFSSAADRWRPEGRRTRRCCTSTVRTIWTTRYRTRDSISLYTHTELVWAFCFSTKNFLFFIPKILEKQNKNKKRDRGRLGCIVVHRLFLNWIFCFSVPFSSSSVLELGFWFQKKNEKCAAGILKCVKIHLYKEPGPLRNGPKQKKTEQFQSN